MIRFKLKELVAEYEFQKGKKLTLNQISEGTGIHRVTLSKINNIVGYSTTTDHIDKICEFFGCRIEEVMEYFPMENPKIKKKKKNGL